MQPRRVLASYDLPDNEPKDEYQPCDRHENDRVSGRRLEQSPTQGGDAADDLTAPPIAKNYAGDLIENDGRSRFETGLDERRNERVVAEDPVKRRQQIRIKRQTIERVMIRPLPVQDS